MSRRKRKRYFNRRHWKAANTKQLQTSLQFAYVPIKRDRRG